MVGVFAWLFALAVGLLACLVVGVLVGGAAFALTEGLVGLGAFLLSAGVLAWVILFGKV